MVHFGKSWLLGRFLMIPAVLIIMSVPRACNASGWQASYTYSGTNTSTVPNMQDQVTNWNAGPFTLMPQHLACSAMAGVPSTGGTVSAKSTGTISVTLTWQRAPNDMNDKPPLKVMVKQICTAGSTGTFSAFSQPPGAPPPSCTFTGSLSNGLGSPVTTTTTSTSRSSSCRGVQVLEFKSGSALLPGSDYDRDAMDPITITVPVLSVNATVSGTGQGGQIQTQTGIDYSVSVITWHPHPTNFHQVGPGVDAGNGTLSFHYAWDSSDGDLSHLDQCIVGEWVDYSGNPGRYGMNWDNVVIPPGTYLNGVGWVAYYALYPPYAKDVARKQPTLYPDPWFSATTGQFPDTHSAFAISTPQPPAWPTTDVIVTAAQVYGFHCNTCMSSSPWEFQSLMSGITIKRTMHQISNLRWRLTIEKSNVQSTADYYP